MSNLKINSVVCVSQNNCYPVETELPLWLLFILVGSTYLIFKDIYKTLT